VHAAAPSAGQGRGLARPSLEAKTLKFLGWRGEALRDNPFEPHLAGMAEHHVTLRVLNVVV
jgi:hypothetical protein